MGLSYSHCIFSKVTQLRRGLLTHFRRYPDKDSELSLPDFVSYGTWPCPEMLHGSISAKEISRGNKLSPVRL